MFCKVTYIGHSCFSVELEECVLLFDYYKGNLPTFLPEKEIFVFVSHKHQDHFNPDIFQLSNKYEKILFLLSKDTKMSDNYKKRLRIPEHAWNIIRYVSKNEKFTAGPFLIETLTSTDEGVAFLIQGKGCSLYHAGDLNWWTWKGETKEEYEVMTKKFQLEMEKLRGRKFDISFLPLDGRQEERFYLGFDYFMNITDTKWAFPMHFWDDFSVIEQLKSLDVSSAYRERIMDIQKNGETFLLEWNAQ